MEIYRLCLEFDGLLPRMNTGHTRRHWSVGHREARRWTERLRVGMLMGRHKRPPKPLKMALVRLWRKSSRQPDFDNLVMSFKPVVDALVKLGLIEDDGPSQLDREYLWETAPPRKGSIKIELTEGGRT